jgi:hypothetical protein
MVQQTVSACGVSGERRTEAYKNGSAKQKGQPRAAIGPERWHPTAKSICKRQTHRQRFAAWYVADLLSSLVPQVETMNNE